MFLIRSFGIICSTPSMETDFPVEGASSPGLPESRLIVADFFRNRKYLALLLLAEHRNHRVLWLPATTLLRRINSPLASISISASTALLVPMRPADSIANFRFSRDRCSFDQFWNGRFKHRVLQIWFSGQSRGSCLAFSLSLSHCKSISNLAIPLKTS